MKPSDVLSLLGIAQRGRRLLSGQDVVEREIISKRVYLLIISIDASENAKDKFLGLSLRYDIPVFIWGNSADLGRALGKEKRTVIGITDRNFSKEVRKRLNLLTGVGDIDKITRL